MLMPGRTYSSEAYSWGFNGKEKDDEISGGGNNLDFGARIYDSRLGRWMSVDPKSKNAPGLTPYRGFFNNPIYIIDPDGKFEIKGSTGGKTKVERKQNKQEIRFLKQMVKELQKEMNNWDNNDWTFIKDNTGMEKEEYLEMFKNGKGPVLKFTDTEKRSSGLSNGDNQGNSTTRDRYAEANAQEITLDEGFYNAFKDIKASTNSNADFRSLSHPGLTFGPISAFNRSSFLRNEKAELLKFAIVVLGHEAQHSGAAIKGLPATRLQVPFATFERGELYELHFYGDVKDHQDYGYGVYNAFEARKYLPGKQNLDPGFKANRANFWNSLYGR